jgi:hypothetical protein
MNVNITMKAFAQLIYANKKESLAWKQHFTVTICYLLEVGRVTIES